MAYNTFLGFDPTTIARVETLGGSDQVPNGAYMAAVTFAERMVAKRNEECCYWRLRFTILDEEFKGCEIPVRFNSSHQNPEVVELGRGALCHYLDCIGNTDPQCEADLCNVPVLITVRNKKNEFTGINGKPVVATVSEIVRIDPLPGIVSPALQPEPAA